MLIKAEFNDLQSYNPTFYLQENMENIQNV